MRNILYIFGFCCLLAMGFTACQEDEALIVEQVNKENLEKKRDSKKHPKLEYTTTDINNHDKLSKAFVNEVDGVLQVILQMTVADKVNLYFLDKYGNIIFKESKTTLNKEKLIEITPAEYYPYSFEITCKNYEIYGEITID